MSKRTRKINTVQPVTGPRRWDEILKRIPADKPAIGAEIGILKGFNAREIVKARPLIKHIMIDPWDGVKKDKSYLESLSDDSKGDQAFFDRCFKIAMIRVQPWLARCEIMKMKSIDAAKIIKDNSLDYVFIDADHSYAGVKRDIETWWPKVRLGGWIGGHDYDKRFYGVMTAVDEAFPSEIERGGDNTWFVRK